MFQTASKAIWEGEKKKKYEELQTVASAKELSMNADTVVIITGCHLGSCLCDKMSLSKLGKCENCNMRLVNLNIMCTGSLPGHGFHVQNHSHGSFPDGCLRYINRI